MGFLTVRAVDGPLKIIKPDGSLVVIPSGQSLRVHAEAKIIAPQAMTQIEVTRDE